MLLKKVTEKTYRKVKTPQDIQLQRRVDVTGQLIGVSAFVRGEFHEATALIVGQGYIELRNKPTVASSVFAFKNNGSALINKASGYGTPDFEVYDQFFIFKNGVNINGYVSSGVYGNIQIGDKIFIYYGYGFSPYLKQQVVSITSVNVTQGYVDLVEPVAFPEHAVAFVAGGAFLTNRFAYTATNGDYLIYDQKFVFRNNVVLDGYTSEGLSELLDIGDRIVVVHM